MIEQVERSLQQVWTWLLSKNSTKDLNSSAIHSDRESMGESSHEGSADELQEKKQRKDQKEQMKIIKKGPAMRVIFFYPGEEGTYVDHAEVTLYENGIVHITSNQEESTTHLQNCEILWRFETDAEERANKVRLLKPKSEPRSSEDATPSKLDPQKNLD